MNRRTLIKTAGSAAVACTCGAPLLALAREAVATVLGRTIYRDELDATGSNLGTRLLPPLLQRFAQEQRLTATPREIDEFLAQMPPLSAVASAGEREAMRKIAQQMILDWKISKALYQRYGGEVIFQQMNPLEPVGAMRQFLEEQERAKAFTIHDAQVRERFYDDYRRAHASALPPSEVDFDKPWWLK